jgi:GTP-binding protein
VGRPNVGKSSILNALVAEDRSLVDAVPGTTRDPVDSHLQIAQQRILRLVDTAGMRRQVRVSDPIEYFSLLRSRRTLARVDAALLVVDASEGVTTHDQHLAEQIVEHGRACVVALNKWDLVPSDAADLRRLEQEIVRRLRFLPWASTVRTSALTGRNTHKLIPSVTAAIEAHRLRLTTSAVNRIVGDAQQARPHPRSGGRPVKIYYAVQAGIAPPSFLLFANARLDPGYVRYIDGRIRAEEPFHGTPLSIRVRVKSRREVNT